MRIAIGVHGRFHAFDLAQAALQQGADVQLLTHYPKSRLRAYGFPLDHARTFPLHFVLEHAARRVAHGEPPAPVEATLKQAFGRWVAHRVTRDGFDVVHCWSGVAEEAFRKTGALRVLTRGSSHIRHQQAVLREESARTGCQLEMPSAWIVAREEREYELADVILVPSRFARASFAGLPGDGKVISIALAGDAGRWRPDPAVVAARVERLRSGAPLHVLFAGSISYRKGMHDMKDVVAELGRTMEFRFVGKVLPECAPLVGRMAAQATFDGHVSQEQLKNAYAWADVFVFPSIEEGLATVLRQAQVAALPIIATENSGAGELLDVGGQGWLVPMRDAAAVSAELRRYDADRARAAAAVEALYAKPPARTWDDVATDYLAALRARVPA